MKIALAVAALAALPGLALAQTQIPAMTVPAVQVDFESTALGATTIAAINAAHPGANIANIQAIAPLAALGNYSGGFALGRALGLNPDGSGGLFILDPGQDFGGADGYRIDLGMVSTQVGLSIADFNGTKNVDFYLGGVPVGNSTVSGAGGPLVTFYEHISGFDRVDITGGPNYVIPEIWVEGANSLTTLFADNNSGSPGGGVYFDVTVGANPIQIIRFEVNSSAVVGTAIAFEAYTHAGGAAGFENSSAGWTLVATGSGSAAGQGIPTTVTLNGPFVLPPNTTLGMALTLGPAAGHAYTNGNGANQHYADANVALDLGAANNAIFGPGLNSPRVWNGTITYNLFCDPCDVNCNGIVNAIDIAPFLDLLFSGAVPCSSCAGDADGNGVVDAFDAEFLLACLFGGSPPVPGVGPGFRIFFDTSGNAGNNAAPHPGSGTLSYGNPSLPGGGRLYIYGEFQAGDQTILSPNFDITIDGGTITGAWNYNGPGQDTLTGDNRWDAAAPNPVINPGGTSVSFTAANLTHMGLKNGVFADLFDIQHDNTRNDGDTLLGYIDVVAPGAASVWLTVGQQGFAIQGGGPTSPILFGYGDASVAAGVVGNRTQIADATVVCEPCDVDCSGLVNALDIDPFLSLLFSGAVPCSACAGDADGNGVVDAFDTEFFLACLFGGSPPVPGVGPGLRIFFDESGNAGSDAAPHPGSGTLSYGTPVLPAGGGRLYIYGEFQDNDQNIISPNFDIAIDGGTITGAWNYNGPGQDTLTGDNRWDAAAPNPVINPGGTSVSFTAANLTHMGLKNGAFADLFDIQHDNTRNDGDTLLGYIDVVAPGAASVWLTVGQQGFAIRGGGPASPILFGYGDASVVAGVVGVRTQIADATVVSAGPPGACCLPPNGMCVDGESAVSCNLLGGAFQGGGSQCAALADWDGDGIPDVCDDDDDNDGVLDVDDVCPMNVVGLAVDSVSGRPLGDMNGDCAANGADVSGFVAQLLRP